jgi:hypothetical protein
MTVVAALTAALKAIPEIASAIRELGQLYRTLREEAIEKKFDELRGQVNATLTRIDKATTDEERRELAARLSDLISK